MPCDPATPLLGMDPQKAESGGVNTHVYNVACSIIHNKEEEAMQVSIVEERIMKHSVRIKGIFGD